MKSVTLIISAWSTVFGEDILTRFKNLAFTVHILCFLRHESIQKLIVNLPVQQENNTSFIT